MPTTNSYSLSDCRRDADAIAAQYGLSGNLLFSLALQESGCKDRIGGDGEIGVTQILPGTFAQFGCTGNQHNAIDDFKCTGKILQTYLSKYGSAALSLAAYNAGAGNVKRCPDGSYGVPRSSTVQYIMNILQRAGIPVDTIVTRGCNGAPSSSTGTPSSGQAAGSQSGSSGDIGSISGTLSLPSVRGIIIYGLALILIVVAVSRLK